jgi:hypothetical protein
MKTYGATHTPAPVPLPTFGLLHGLCCELFVRSIHLTPGTELIPLRWTNIDFLLDTIHLTEFVALDNLGENSSNS